MKTYHKNPRRITNTQVDRLRDSLADLGDLGGIVHDLNSDEIIGGNQRGNVFNINHCEIELTYQADEPDEQGTVGLGYVIWKGKRYAYRQVRWTPEQCEEANIKANKLGGTWDWDILADQFEFDDLVDWGFSEDELLGLEFEPEETEAAGTDTEPQVNRADELRKEWGTELGQMWQLGPHRLIVGDCTDAEVVARLMGGERFDMCFTSPPYNSGNGGYKTDYSGKTKKFYVESTDDRTEDEWVLFCEKALSACGLFARSDESAVLWNVMYTARCRSGYGRALFGGNQPFGVKETICWDKGQGFPTASRGILSRNWELIFVLSRGDTYITTQGDNEPRWAKWEIPRPQKQNEDHHATFPVELPERAINDFCVEKSIIYDPFAGSGTTIIAADNLNRVCRAVEISPAYCAVILDRYYRHSEIKPELIG